MMQFREQAQQAIPVAKEEVIQFAKDRMKQGLAPPAEIYRIEYRHSIDWASFPSWARPVDPELYEGCCHEG
jgi:hypothetical protein